MEAGSEPRPSADTITVTHDDGTTTEHTVSATAYIPGRTIHRDVTLTIVHPEHVKAEVGGAFAHRQGQGRVAGPRIK